MMKKWYYIAPLAILAMAGFIVLGGEVVKLLWNWLLPPLFGWREIGFWQGLGMLALCRILFGGFGCHSQHGPGFRRRWAERHGGMTPEERERFRQGMLERCGFRRPEGERTGQAAQ
jgi:hypothetical protein